MIAWLAALLLSCPPTTTATTPEDTFLASPWGWQIHDEIAEPPVAELDPGTLPIWDLEAGLAALGSSDDERFIAWAITEAMGKRMTAHELLVAALASSSLPGELMLWWLDHAPANGDARDALNDAHARATAPKTLVLLEIALALLHWEASCPVELGADGACRMPGSSEAEARDILVRRDAIAVELAEHWTRKAQRRAKRIELEPGELATAALLGRLEIAATNESYEATLTARAPEGLSIWADESTDRKSEQDRVRSFFMTQTACTRELFDGYSSVESSSPEAAMTVLLRRAKLLLAVAEAFDREDRERREDARSRAETGKLRFICALPDARYAILEQAEQLAQQCVDIGTTLGGPGELREACEALIERHDHPPLAELVPEPGASVRMQSQGVVGL